VAGLLEFEDPLHRALPGNDAQQELVLQRAIARTWQRPLEFVTYNWSWGVEGTPLAIWDGPDKWQRRYLIDLGDEVEERNFVAPNSVLPIRMAVGSGHGIGKSALVAWLILWLMSTRPFCRGTVTASTSPQLEARTIPELAKWLAWSLNGHWFKLDSNKITALSSPRNWRCDFQTARKENSEAFAGQHEASSSSFYIFDESSGVPDEIKTVAEGGLTDGEPFFLAFGNRTKTTGWFNRCFTREAHRWINYTIDSRQAKMTNKEQIRRWAEDWGEDSDFFRVRVMGLAPKTASEQFISGASVADARTREATCLVTSPLLLGVDVARFGKDRSVISVRKGNDARTHKAKVFRGIDTMELADEVASLANELRANTIFVDGGGIGGGVVDRLRQLGFQNVVEINFGGKSDDREFYDKRTAMWGRLRDAVKRGLAIEDSNALEDDLVAQEYYVDGKTRTTRLVSKEDLHRLGEESPDEGDALALTYASATPEVVDQAGGALGGPAARSTRRRWSPLSKIEDSARGLR